MRSPASCRFAVTFTVRAVSLPENFLDPADEAVFEAHLDAVGMRWGVGENVKNDALGTPARPLVFLEHDRYPETGPYIASVLSVHALQYEGEREEWQAPESLSGQRLSLPR